MTKAPSIKEALERARRYVEHHPGTQAQYDLRAIDAALATFQPDGERREAIARMIDPEAFEDDRPTWHDRRVRALDKADTILAFGLVQNEAGIRRDEREKCADQADAHVVKEFDDAWIIARAIRNRNAVEIAKSSGTKVHPRVAAIRSARDGGAET